MPRLGPPLLQVRFLSFLDNCKSLDKKIRSQMCTMFIITEMCVNEAIVNNFRQKVTVL
jgi:hypothetical protein